MQNLLSPTLRSPWIRTTLTLGFIAGIISLPACSKDDPVGSVVIPFVLGANLDCASEDVKEVRITLTPEEGGDEQVPEYEETVECETGQVAFERIPTGLYQIHAEALAGDNTVLFDNENSDDTAEIFDDQMSQAESVRLSGSPAKLSLKLALFDGGTENPVDCNDVSSIFTKVKIRAFENEGADAVFEYDFPCDVGLQAPAPDPDRDLDGEDTDTVQIQLVNSNNGEVGIPQTLMFTPVGRGRSIQVNVTFDKDGSVLTAKLQ